VIEAAILIEAGRHTLFDKLILTACSVETQIARGMVGRWGMSPKIGPIGFNEEAQSGLGLQRPYSEATARDIDNEVKRIAEECFEQATSLLKANRARLDTLAQALLKEDSLDEQQILECAASFEGHADNLAAALFGGLTISAPGAVVQRIDVPDELRAIVFAPHQRLTTRQAREAVAQQFSREDAVFNASRCALLIRALLLRDYPALREAMDDRWHQPQRAALFPAMAALIEAAYRGGADGACLAGAGPSILALCARDPAPVEAALQSAADVLAVPGAVLRLRPRNFGSRVEVHA